MKVKLKVDGFVGLRNNKGYILNFLTPYGERIGCYVSNENSSNVFDTYVKDSIHILDVVPYRTNSGGLGLTVNLPREVSNVELF